MINSVGLEYNNKFIYCLGGDCKLPYEDNTLDFVICSCVIQHLNSEAELLKGLLEISRVLKYGGKFYLMFKAGSNDTLFTHYNKIYNENREFRVFDPESVKLIAIYCSLKEDSRELSLDDNWIPYCRMIFTKF